MSRPISRAEMKDEVNETWQKCLDERGIMTDFERGYEQGKADAKKPWVGLTDEEIDHAAEQSDNYAAFHAGVRCAQDKLKEKNGG